jgi:hypothetical protein
MLPDYDEAKVTITPQKKFYDIGHRLSTMKNSFTGLAS